VTSSAQNDLMRANQIAKEMVEHYGMSQNFGLRYALPNNYGVKEISLESQKVVDKDIELILNECYSSAKGIVNEHRTLLDKIATELLVHETLDTFEIEKILQDGKLDG
jgi:cell division protease FtsH